jgi:cytochrome c biogenesis protein CcdA/thiol-disulfide isomerase/thioredoxin
LAVAFLGGLITGLSPCIVPVVPVIVAGGSSGTARSRPYLIIAGLVVSFSLTVLTGSAVLSALGLPQNFLMWLGISLLGLLALGLLLPAVGELLERPFSRLGGSRYAKSGGGFVLGLSLGLVFVPCAGPVLGAITTAGANHRINASSLSVALLYALGTAIPLLIFALIAQRAIAGWQKMRAHLPVVRRVAGAVMAVATVALALGWFDSLQKATPGYTSALEDHIESNAGIAGKLNALSGEHANKFVEKANADKARADNENRNVTVALPKLGLAPNFTGIVSWFNTPGDRPLSLSQLRGKVVLVDFWTYSCINCQRALPHVEGWYSDYKNDGFVVVGVSTPEFAFEHVVSNVRSAAGGLGIHYPVAIDNNYQTWDAYNNEYWPADYLIDPTGEVRAYSFGEGGYDTMEKNIRTLLAANGVKDLPAATDVPNKTPTVQTTPESYIGYEEAQYESGTPVVDNKAIVYKAPNPVPPNTYAFNGTWDDHSQEATAGADASIDLNFLADDVYLVMGGTGTVAVTFDGRPLQTVHVTGVPRLYTLFSENALESGLLGLTFSPGVQAYDFTFG